MLGSLAAHVVVIALLSIVPADDPVAVDLSAYHVQFLRIRSGVVFYPPSESTPGPAKDWSRSGSRPRVVFASAATSKTAQVLEPKQLPETAPVASSQPPALPKVSKQNIALSRVETEESARLIPVLQMPAIADTKPGPADINIAAAKTVPVLATENSSTPPVGDPFEPYSGAVESHKGAAANPLDVQHAQTAPDDLVALAPGLRISLSQRLERPQSAIRVLHPPNGHFDVVLTESTPRDDPMEPERVLTGDSVYTVYLRVGDAKEWVLKYCVPAREHPVNTPFHIFVEAVKALLPPYPINTAIPTTVAERERPSDITFHGMLTASGELRSMDTSDREMLLAREIAALLSEWRFRPAFKSERPTDIEILLLIPRRG